MAEVQCSRCDRRYSAFRGKCPFCGKRRRKSGKRVSDSDNATWKFVIGILLLVILIAAVIVLLVTSLSGSEDDPTPPDDSETPSFDQSGGVTDSDSTLPPVSPSPDEPSPSVSSEPPVIATESVEITWNGNLRTDVSMKVGEELQFGARTVPEESADTPIWSSDNEDVFIVLQSGKVTAVGAGTANLTVTCGAASATCIIRVK